MKYMHGPGLNIISGGKLTASRNCEMHSRLQLEHNIMSGRNLTVSKKCEMHISDSNTMSGKKLTAS